MIISYRIDGSNNPLTQVDLTVTSALNVVAPNGHTSFNTLAGPHSCSGTLAGAHPDVGHCVEIAGSNRFYWVSGGTWNVTWNHGE